MAKITTPASQAARARARRAEEEGYHPRLCRVDYNGGKSEFEIELKYFDGEPVIREIKRISTPGRRVYSSVKDLPTVAKASASPSVHAAGRDVGYRARATENVGGEVLCQVF